MKDVRGKNSIYDFGVSHFRRGGIGFLLSGGCTDAGSIPLTGDVFDQIERLTAETDLKINLHTGLVDREIARRIRDSGVGKVSFDVIGNDQTIKDVLHLDKRVSDYKRSYGIMNEYGIDIVPHILVGFHYGVEGGEEAAIDIVDEFKPEKVVMITLIPTPGTAMKDISGPEDDLIMKVGTRMREALKGELIIGCMRPRGRFDVEIELLDIGFKGIVNPSKRVLDRINERGWETRTFNYCCAF
jgi:hypothetical protein